MIDIVSNYADMKEAQNILGVSRQRIHDYINSGKLEVAFRKGKGGKAFFDVEELFMLRDWRKSNNERSRKTGKRN